MFLQNYVNNFDINNFSKNLELETFWSDYMYVNDRRTWKKKHEFELIQSNSSLRKVFDTYLKIIDDNDEDFQIEKEIFFAKIWYQEKRKLFPNWFTKNLREIYKNINDKNRFKQFLEVFVAYHKYFNPYSK